MIPLIRNTFAPLFVRSPLGAGFGLAMSAQFVLGVFVISAFVVGGDGPLPLVISFICGLPFILLTAAVLNIAPDTLAGAAHRDAVEQVIAEKKGAVGAFRLGYILGPAALIAAAYLMLAIIGEL
ncbi:MAG: hypothetical protein GYB36_09660 [Alphaproteobacteria bacterium]|nr:hypothetical protein [Alphaproteobacteria bacterium]